jgi:acetolactate synthase I/II/III large subunit
LYTASHAFLDALVEAGVSHLFVNLGSDHPAIVEALAEAAITGKPMPKVITCPNEMVALSAAQGFAQITGRAQAVLVHVDCGTQNMAGAIHNVSRCRTPVLILSGASPVTQEGELKGGRNEFIHWLQDAFDQRGIVRGYMKYDNEIRTGRNMKQLVFRALQSAHSAPQGPAYLMAVREVLEEEVPPHTANPAHFGPIQPGALPHDAAQLLAKALLVAKRPVIVTSYLGRNQSAVATLRQLAERLGAGVLESCMNYLNFPADHPLYLGSYGNENHQQPALAEADLVLIVDCDVPWIPMKNKPGPAATVYHIDIDPIKERIPLFYIPASGAWRADSNLALGQILAAAEQLGVDTAAATERRNHYQAMHASRRQMLTAKEAQPAEIITVEYFMARLRELAGADAVMLSEAITNFTLVSDHMMRSEPGTLFTSGASSLGWHGGAAVGMKLAQPGKTIIAITGDGSFLFSLPATVHWMARRYQAPILEVVLNNGGWQAPRFSAIGVYPDGLASKSSENLNVAFDPAPDYAGIAEAAGGALAVRVSNPAEVDAAIASALNAVRNEGRSAVIDVKLKHL